MILSSLLVSNGMAADLAESGEECLELCRKNTYDLILLDYEMPALDGYDVMRLLHETLQTSEIPIIFLTIRMK